MIDCDEVREHLQKTGQYCPQCCDSCHDNPHEWEMSSIYDGMTMVSNTCCTLYDDAKALIDARGIKRDADTR